METYSSKIIEYNRKIKVNMFETDGARKVPVLCSEQTKWQAIKMIPLMAYLEHRDPNRPNFEKIANNYVDSDYDFIRSLDEKRRNEKGKWEHRLETEKDQLVKERKNLKQAELVKAYEKKKIFEWESIVLRECRYRNPIIVNRDLVSQEDL